MLELGIVQAQIQFKQILTETVTVIDIKNKDKKAVILPYHDYCTLLSKSRDENSTIGSFDKFVGILNKNFKVNDIKYNDIIK